MDDLPEGALYIGALTAHYYLAQDGTPMVTVDRPDFETIPAVVQLGIVRLLDLDVMHGPDAD